MTQRWQKRRAAPHHADDWLMTYADLITLLLCFFAIAIITLVPKKLQLASAPSVTQPAVHAPQPMTNTHTFVQAAASGDPLKSDPFFSSGSFVAGSDETPAPAAPEKDASSAAQTTVFVALPTLPLKELAAAIVKPAEPQTQSLGNRITILEMNSAAFFASGSAILSASGKQILHKAAIDLQKEALKEYRITVEGHTDDTPVHTAQFPSNWELSTARAAAVLHCLLDEGLPAIRLRAAGYADTFPKAPNRDAQGLPIATNRAENRRVVITLEKLEKN